MSSVYQPCLQGRFGILSFWAKTLEKMGKYFSETVLVYTELFSHDTFALKKYEENFQECQESNQKCHKKYERRKK
jgi:hypothetical protein